MLKFLSHTLLLTHSLSPFFSLCSTSSIILCKHFLVLPVSSPLPGSPFHFHFRCLSWQNKHCVGCNGFSVSPPPLKVQIRFLQMPSNMFSGLCSRAAGREWAWVSSVCRGWLVGNLHLILQTQFCTSASIRQSLANASSQHSGCISGLPCCHCGSYKRSGCSANDLFLGKS